jgi:hypothetical protein
LGYFQKLVIFFLCTKFRHTYKKRTKDSAIAFASGAFPDQPVFIPDPLDEDKVLRVSLRLKGNLHGTGFLCRTTPGLPDGFFSKQKYQFG